MAFKILPDYESNHAAKYFARDGEQTMGRVMISRFLLARIAEIDDIRVYPEFRHQGIGTELLNQVIDWASNNNFTHIIRVDAWCQADPENLASGGTQLFLDNGFKQCGPFLTRKIS